MLKDLGVVILARLSSSRLPGKALMEIEGKPVLGHILSRLKTVVPAENIILATSDESLDDALEAYAQKERIACHRGSLEKVGERFYAAAKSLGTPYAARINGDNIFLDPAVLEELGVKASHGNYRFLSNVPERTYPKGMSVEIVALDYYQEQLQTIKSEPYCNEHVMVCLYQEPCPTNHFYQKNRNLPEASGIQLALDTAEDLKRTQWMLARIPQGQFDLKTTFVYYQQYEESLKR